MSTKNHFPRPQAIKITFLINPPLSMWSGFITLTRTYPNIYQLSPKLVFFIFFSLKNDNIVVILFTISFVSNPALYEMVIPEY